MKTVLRIILFFSFLICFLQPANAVVHHNQTVEKTTKTQQVRLKRIIKKVKKAGKKFQNYSKNTIAKKKKFGKIGSISLFVLISTVAFTVLKLTGVIAWSWFWVLSPLIFYVGLIILIGLIALFAILALKEANE